MTNYHHHTFPPLSKSGLVLALILTVTVVGIVRAQGQLPGHALTTGPANNLRPAWSSDGQQIAYFSNRSGNNDIWAMDADGSHQRQLTSDPSDDRRPAWSPDDQHLAFDSDRAGSRDIWVMDADGSHQRQLTSEPGQESFASWSPDGTQIAYYVFSDGVLSLWIMNADGTNPRPVVNPVADQRLNQCTFACHVPAWSPDSRQIAYQEKNHTQIWVVDADGQNPHTLSHGEAHEHFPTWMPDGRIRYLSEHINHSQEPVNDVWVMNADGTNPTLLFADIPHGGPLEFRPDDDIMVAFHSPRGGNFDIYTTLLGQVAEAAASAAAPAEPAPPTESAEPAAPAAPTEPAPPPERPAELAPTVAAAPVASPSGGLPGTALAAVIVAVAALGTVLALLYLARRGRASS